MKRLSAFFAVVLLLVFQLLLPSCRASVPTETAAVAVTDAAVETQIITVPTESTLMATQPEITAAPVPVIDLTGEEQSMLLKLGMAERGNTGCTECIALVMRTVLNRVESGRFGKSVRSVILAQDQFTPVADGSFYSAEPNEHCREALELVICGWDESQGALFYEWCEGESWHSQNLHLLFQHCDTRFYD